MWGNRHEDVDFVLWQKEEVSQKKQAMTTKTLYLRPSLINTVTTK
jgi:hypothetical protein